MVRRSIQFVQSLFRSSSSQNAQHGAYYYASSSSLPGCALSEAVEQNDIERVRCIILHLPESARKTAVDYQDAFGVTCFHRACQLQRLSIVQFLLKHTKPNLNLTNDYGSFTCLMIAVCKNSQNIVSALLTSSHQIDVDLQSNAGDSALMKAAFRGTLEIVKMLIEHGASVDLRSKSGADVLMRAVSERHTKLSNYLIVKTPVAVNICSCADTTYYSDSDEYYQASMETTLDLAVQNNMVSTLKLLLLAGATQSLKNQSCKKTKAYQVITRWIERPSHVISLKLLTLRTIRTQIQHIPCNYPPMLLLWPSFSREIELSSIFV